MLFLFLYFTPELFCFFCICYFVLVHSTVTFLMGYCFVILKDSVLFVLHDPDLIFFVFSYFHPLICFFQLYCQTCLLLSSFGLFIPLCPCVFSLP